jgi:hypothetical protein
MSQKTDSSDFAPGFLWQIVLLTIVAMGIVLVSSGTLSWDLKIGSRWESIRTHTTLYPWVYGGKHTIANGLRSFSGQPSVIVPIAQRAATLMVVLIGMVVCPTVFLLEWRQRRLKDDTAKKRPPLKISGMLYLVCGWVTIVSGVGLVPVAYISETTRADLRHRQAIQENRDAMVNELNFLCVDAAQHYILPKELGGGGRTFEGYSIPGKFAKTGEGAYTVTTSKNAALFRGVSLRLPLCVINVQADSMGGMKGWKYEGEFQ